MILRDFIQQLQELEKVHGGNIKVGFITKGGDEALWTLPVVPMYRKADNWTADRKDCIALYADTYDTDFERKPVWIEKKPLE